MSCLHLMLSNITVKEPVHQTNEYTARTTANISALNSLMKINLKFLSHFFQLSKIQKIKAFLPPKSTRTVHIYYVSTHCLTSFLRNC